MTKKLLNVRVEQPDAERIEKLLASMRASDQKANTSDAIRWALTVGLDMIDVLKDDPIKQDVKWIKKAV